MKCVALLRGINVGGNNLIKMADLKAVFEKLGFSEVQTYINSGNVIFTTERKDKKILTELIEKALSEEFHYKASIVLFSQDQLKQTVIHAPTSWQHPDDIRCYVAFIKDRMNERDVSDEVELKEGVDFLKVGERVLYMTTLLSGLSKSGFTKLIGKKVYQEITVRNFTTVKKLLEIMEKR